MCESQELLRGAAGGDREAIERLIRLHEPSLLAFVRASAGPALRARESVRDILQEILLELVQGLKAFEYRSEAEFRGWLYTLARRRVQDRARHFRSEKRRGKHARSLQETGSDELLILGYSSLSSPPLELQRREDIRRLESAFTRLSPGDSEVLSLAFFCGMSAPAVARHLGIGVEAARKRKIRAQARLAALWSQTPPDAPDPRAGG